MTRPYSIESALRKNKTEYRDEMVINYQMLDYIRKHQSTRNTAATSKTRILYSCRLSSTQYKIYIKFLNDNGFVEQHIDPDRFRNIYYMITNKGVRYMEIIERMKALFDNDTKHFVFPEKLDVF